MPTFVVSTRTVARINAAFDRRYPELLSRLSRLARGFQDREEVCAELAAFSYLNFRSVFLRRGECLEPKAMAFVAWKRALTGRSLARQSIRDAHSPVAQRRRRVHLIHLSRLRQAKNRQGLTDTAVDRIVNALSTRERERPDVRAATRLDWQALATQLPQRLRRILCWLAIGASKTWIARKLKLTNGRISQLLDMLGRKITAFFGADIVPATAMHRRTR